MITQAIPVATRECFEATIVAVIGDMLVRYDSRSEMLLYGFEKRAIEEHQFLGISKDGDVVVTVFGDDFVRHVWSETSRKKFLVPVRAWGRISLLAVLSNGGIVFATHNASIIVVWESGYQLSTQEFTGFAFAHNPSVTRLEEVAGMLYVQTDTRTTAIPLPKPTPVYRPCD